MQDPLADKAQDWMAYRYGFNNPMRFTDPTGMFEAGMMRAGKNASIQERSAGKDTQNMEGETDALDEGRYQNLQNSVLGYLDAQGTEGSNNNTSKGGLQSMADAGRFSLGGNKSGPVTSGDYLQRLGLIYSAAGVVGDNKLKSGGYTQLNGTKGNFNDRPYKQLSNWAKTNKAFAESLSKAGKLANGLVIVTTVYDVLDDGNLKTSTAINAALTGVAIAFPVTAPFILTYGILDYTFGFSEFIDANSSGINTGIYD